MKLKLVKKLNEAKGTKTFFWEPEKNIEWLPGQYYYYTIPKLLYDDTRGPTRHFTISTSPSEGNLLGLTTRIRESSGYKNSLDQLNIGEVVEGEGPSGTFILDESEKEKSHVFLAGGIGITPFRVFAKYSIDNNLNIPMYLIYSNSLVEEITFNKELENWDKNYDFFKMATTISKSEKTKEKWDGLQGRIDKNMIGNLISKWKLDINKLTFWVVGPPAFVNSMEDILENMKISSSNMRTEKFTGY